MKVTEGLAAYRLHRIATDHPRRRYRCIDLLAIEETELAPSDWLALASEVFRAARTSEPVRSLNSNS
jgi:hypothetical protein